MSSRLLRSFARGTSAARVVAAGAPPAAPAPATLSEPRLAPPSTRGAAVNESPPPSAVALLAPAIKRAARGSAAQVEAVMELRHLFRARATAEEFARIANDIVAEGLLDVLVALLGERATAFEAAWCILNVSSIRSGARAVVRAGALAPLVALVRPSTSDSALDDVCEQACWCLANIAGDGAPLRDAVLATEGAVDAVALALHPGTVRWGERAAARAADSDGDALPAVGRSRWETACWLLVNLVRSSPAPSLATIRPLIAVLGSALPTAAAYGEEEALSHLCWASSYIVSATSGGTLSGVGVRGDGVATLSVSSAEARVLAFVDHDMLRPAFEVLGSSASRRKCIYPLLRTVTSIVIGADRVALNMIIRQAIEMNVVANLITLLPSSAEHRSQEQRAAAGRHRRAATALSTMATTPAASSATTRGARHDELAAATLLVLDMIVCGCAQLPRPQPHSHSHSHSHSHARGESHLSSRVAATMASVDAAAKLRMQATSGDLTVRATASKILRWLELHDAATAHLAAHLRAPHGSRPRVVAPERFGYHSSALAYEWLGGGRGGSAPPPLLELTTAAATGAGATTSRHAAIGEPQSQAELLAFANSARDAAAALARSRAAAVASSVDDADDTSPEGVEAKTSTPEGGRASCAATAAKEADDDGSALNSTKPPAEFLCPITREVMDAPVMLVGDGHTYEHAAILRWLAIRQTSPMTNQSLALVPSFAEIPVRVAPHPPPHRPGAARLTGALHILQGRLRPFGIHHAHRDGARTAVAPPPTTPTASRVNPATMLVPNHSLRKLIVSWQARTLRK